MKKTKTNCYFKPAEWDSDVLGASFGEAKKAQKTKQILKKASNVLIQKKTDKINKAETLLKESTIGSNELHGKLKSKKRKKKNKIQTPASNSEKILLKDQKAKSISFMDNEKKNVGTMCNTSTVIKRNKKLEGQNRQIKKNQLAQSTISLHSLSQTSKIINSNPIKISKRKRRQLRKLELENKQVENYDNEQTQEIDTIIPKSSNNLHFNKHENVNGGSLRHKLLEKLKGSRFRYLNEQMYTTKGSEALKMFRNDPDAFLAYHEGYRHQVQKWPLNPLDIIIGEIKKMPTTYIIADFGCGDARLSKSVPHTVHSFDLVASSEDVTACDMANVPLGSKSIDVAVYCLSLMGVNIKDYLLEANRVLKIGGILKIAEVSSRFTDINNFVKEVMKYGFKVLNKNLSNEMFYFINFNKIGDPNSKSNLPKIELKACMYKKR